MPPESASVPPPTLPFIVPLIRLCPFFRSPGFLPRVYLVPSPLITRRWATNPNTIINAVASVFIHASLELRSANSLFFETMLHARFVALSRLCSPFNLRAEREGVEGANESGIRWRVTENSIIPLSLSLSTTVLTPIACVSSAVRQICVTRKEERGGVRDYRSRKNVAREVKPPPFNEDPGPIPRGPFLFPASRLFAFLPALSS